MRKKAFTLVELLVVITIIGLFVALIMPVIGKARGAARKAQCANNLRQHGIAWYLYLDDHDECFPKTAVPPSDTQCDMYSFGGKAGLAPGGYDTYTADMRPLNRYLDVNNTSSADIFHCPYDTAPIGFFESSTHFNFIGNSYAYNSNLAQRRLNTITSSKSKVYLEVCSWLISPGHGGKGYVLSQPEMTYVMALFVDGHVKGPYNYKNDFDSTPNGGFPERPVYLYPNMTP